MAVASARIPSAWPLRGTWWGSPALVLSPGTVQVSESRSISFQRAPLPAGLGDVANQHNV